jgi:hypothetical protein
MYGMSHTYTIYMYLAINRQNTAFHYNMGHNIHLIQLTWNFQLMLKKPSHIYKKRPDESKNIVKKDYTVLETIFSLCSS